MAVGAPVTAEVAAAAARPPRVEAQRRRIDLSSLPLNVALILLTAVWIIPTHPTLENFQLLLSQTFFLRSVFNTLVVCFANVSLQVFLCSLAGFAFAKYRFRGRNLLFTAVLGTGYSTAKASSPSGRE